MEPDFLFNAGKTYEAVIYTDKYGVSEIPSVVVNGIDCSNAYFEVRNGVNTGIRVETKFSTPAPQDIVFDGDSGTVNGSGVSLHADFTLQGGKTLTIENGKTLTIPSGKTLTVEENGVIVIAEGGTLVVQDGGTLTNNGTLYVDGTFTGTADNLYYPLSYTLSSEFEGSRVTGIDGTREYNGKTYGKAGSTVRFNGLPSLGGNQVNKLVVTTSDGSKNISFVRGTGPCFTMPFASTDIYLDMITDCEIWLECNGGTLNDESLDKVLEGDKIIKGAYCLESKTAPLPTDITRSGYTFGGWYDNIELTGEPVVNKIADCRDYYAKWEVDEKPVLTGLEKGKNYCEDVIFTISDEDDIQTVTVNGKALTADKDGKYTIEQGAGTVTLVFIDSEGHTAEMTLTVYDGHDFGKWQSNGDDTHTRLCQREDCGFSETEDCTGGEATCTSKAICDYCKTEYGEVDSSNHDLEKNSAKDATVTETGDRSHMALWFALLFVSGAGVIGTTVYGRKKRAK